MKIVERYILRRSLLLAIGALFWTLSIVWIVQALGKLDIVTDSGQSALAFFKLATFTLPAIVPLVIPFAIIIGVAQTLSAMNADSELVVINAAGSSRMVTIRPVLILALGGCIASFVVQNGIDPGARLAVRMLVANANADLLSSVIQEGTFKKVQKGLFLQVGERKPDGSLGGIMVADSRQKDTDLIYYAKNGVVGKSNGQSVLVMSDGIVQRKTPPGDVSVIHFSSYMLDLSSFASAKSFLVLTPRDRSLAYLWNPDPNDPVYKHAPQQFNAMLHQRLTEWMNPLVFALIALAVAGDARSHREARLHPMATALSLALLVRWLEYFIAHKAETDAAFVPVLYAVPIVAGLVPIWCLATHRTLELPVAWTERIGSLIQRLGERLTVLRLRLFGAISAAGGGQA